MTLEQRDFKQSGGEDQANLCLGGKEQPQSTEANRSGDAFQYSSSEEIDVACLFPNDRKCQTKYVHDSISSSQNEPGTNFIEAIDKSYNGNKGVKFNEHQIMHLINQCMESFKKMKNVCHNRIIRAPGSLTREQQFYSNIILLRILGRKCELSMNDQALTFIDSKLKKFTIYNEYSRSGLSSRSFKGLLSEEGNSCYNRKYATLGQFHGLNPQENNCFTANYSFQRTAKYILALKRYEEEVMQSRVTNHARAQEIGMKLNRIAVYAHENRLWAMESMCRKRGLKIVQDLWNTMSIEFGSENLMVNTDSRTFNSTGQSFSRFISSPRAARLFSRTYLNTTTRADIEMLTNLRNGELRERRYLNEDEDINEYDDCCEDLELNSEVYE